MLQVNGGVLLLHAARARQVGLADALSALTHYGAAERAAGRLSAFCDLAEQDTLNVAIRVTHSASISYGPSAQCTI